MTPRITMFQTAAGDDYARMLAVAEQANRRYCEQHDIAYESFVGVKRGTHPWQATLNRIVYLKEQLEAGYDGWVFYVDADAYVRGQAYDVRHLIAAAQADYFFAPGGTGGEPWDVNAGVFLINLGCEGGKALAEAWYQHFMSTSEAELEAATDWNMVADDQERLHDLLRHREDLRAGLAIVPREFFNNQSATFLRQVLRADSEGTDQRIARLEQGVAEVINGAQDAVALQTPELLMVPQRPRVKMFQTADADNYAAMIAATAHGNGLYCQRHNIEFEQFLGIKRGYHPWHACFNRIVYLKEQVDAGYDGWIFYVDADAYVHDHSVDVRDMIALGDCEGDYYFAPGGETGKRWDVNDGVFFINLGAPAARELTRRWYDHFMGTSDEALREATEWNMVPSDQARLHDILDRTPELLDRLVMLPREVFNNEKASFVRQVLRANAETLEQRVARLEAGVAEALRKTAPDAEVQTTGDGKPMLQDPAQYGQSYDSEFRRVLAQYAADARSFLEWGAGFTTRMIVDHVGDRQADLFVTIDDNGEYLDKVVEPMRDREWLHPACMPRVGPCVDDRDTGLNYSTYPLSLGRKFDFIFIDGRRRMECAMMALLLTHPDTVVVIHDYRRTRYQPVLGFYRVVEDGPQFRVLRPRASLATAVADTAEEVQRLLSPDYLALQISRLAAEPAMLADSLAQLAAADALGAAHRHAQEGQLAAALALVQLALGKAEELGDQEANARVLAASLLERQDRREEAAWMIEKAASLAPDDTGIARDRDRILAALG